MCGLSEYVIGRDAFGDTEVHQVGKFVSVSWTISGFSREEVPLVVTFHGF
jgi:hypothetical protein